MRTLEQIDREIEASSAYLRELRAERRKIMFRWGACSPVLDQMRTAYADPARKVDDICKAFKTSRGQLMRVARLNNWPRRHPPLPVPLAKMSPSERRLYRKVRKIAGRDAAESAVSR